MQQDLRNPAGKLWAGSPNEGPQMARTQNTRICLPEISVVPLVLDNLFEGSRPPATVCANQQVILEEIFHLRTQTATAQLVTHQVEQSVATPRSVIQKHVALHSIKSVVTHFL